MVMMMMMIMMINQLTGKDEGDDSTDASATPRDDTGKHNVRYIRLDRCGRHNARYWMNGDQLRLLRWGRVVTGRTGRCHRLLRVIAH